MWKFGLVGLVILAVVVGGFSLIDGTGSGEVNANATMLIANDDISGFSRAIAPYTWQFPRDHGAHETFQTEWWYYTGNLESNGRRFGYQFTVFRRAMTPETQPTDSEWRTNQVYLAHVTLSDLDAGDFYHDERYSRGSAALAEALPNDRNPDAPYRVFLEDWQVIATNDATTEFKITATSETGFSLDLTLSQAKPPALQGDQGLSPKNDEIGNASYYYSLSRLLTAGEIRVGEVAYPVNGVSWMDHEFSTSALGANALGWDWFGLHFDDGRDLMIGKIRLLGGGREPAFGGLMVAEDGTTRALDATDFDIISTGEWTSPHTNATYAVGWTVTIHGEALGQDAPLTFDITPLALDQELNSGDIAYWEGAVRLSGDISGYGYAELTGYATTMTGRF